MNECIHGDRYKLEDMDERELQICMYRTYKGIIIISDYNSCNISYTIVDKYFPLFFFPFFRPFMLHVSVCPISIKFHFMLILVCEWMCIEGYFIVIHLLTVCASYKRTVSEESWGGPELDITHWPRREGTRKENYIHKFIFCAHRSAMPDSSTLC